MGYSPWGRKRVGLSKSTATSIRGWPLPGGLPRTRAWGRGVCTGRSPRLLLYPRFLNAPGQGIQSTEVFS